MRLLALFGAIVLLAACNSQDPAAHVAVAANFTEPAKEIAQLFERVTGHHVILSFGSTGQLLTQITQDAPFDAFLAADQESPRKAMTAGFGLPDSLFTYAIGKIVLFSTTLDLTDGESLLREGRFEKLAVANPTTAPYGQAALEVLKSLQLYDQLSARIVQGNNIAQTFQFVETGNAEVGFVALSQVIDKDRRSQWIVPENLYTPIRQDAIMLKTGAGNEAARAFIEFLKSPEATRVIQKYGYATEP